LKKTFLLTDKNKDPKRVLEAIKNTIKKYIKREKRKELPEGSNFWRIDCKFGENKELAVEIKFEDITKNINEISNKNLDSFYIELTSHASTMNFKKKEKTTEVEDIIKTEDEN